MEAAQFPRHVIKVPREVGVKRTMRLNDSCVFWASHESEHGYSLKGAIERRSSHQVSSKRTYLGKNCFRQLTEKAVPMPM